MNWSKVDGVDLPAVRLLGGKYRFGRRKQEKLSVHHEVLEQMLNHRINRKLSTLISDYSSLLTLISLALPFPDDFTIVAWPSPHILLSVCPGFILQVTVYASNPFAGSSGALFVHFSIPVAELFPGFAMIFLLWHLPCAALHCLAQPCFLAVLISFIWTCLS